MTPTPAVPSRKSRWLELGLLAAAMLACLLPFAGKPVHIDDPLFVWAARHIREHPFDFFGFEVNWYETWEPMASVTQNPPVACYYLALAGSLFGWGETGLHLAMLLPAWGLLWGTYRLAERFGARPLPAALFTLTTPAFLLCASSLMCDVMMLCLWVWTIILWDRGLQENSRIKLYAAGGLIALTTLTKYFGVCLLPLLAAYSSAVDRSDWRRWLRPLGLAVVLLAAFQAYMWALYRRGGLGGAVAYAIIMGNPSVGAQAFKLFAGLAYLGGCVGVAALVLPWWFSWPQRRVLALVAVTTLVGSLLLSTATKVDEGEYWIDSPFALAGGFYSPSRIPTTQFLSLLGQFILWGTLGSAVLLLAIDDYKTHRDPRALLLFLWVIGTAVFAAYVNWTINGRSVLPLVPAVAILLVRRFDRERREGRTPAWVLPALLVPSAALALVVAWSDQRLAEAHRAAAEQIADEFGRDPGRTLWLQGHWGYQYYLMERGGRPWDFKNPEGRPGDRLVLPSNNYLVGDVPGAPYLGAVEVPSCTWVATMQREAAAGYYSCMLGFGPLPFAFTTVPPERFEVQELPGSPR